MKSPDGVQPRFPGAMLAFFAFMLTVLLGIGAMSAAALWQQSASATMSVSAAANWSIISITCSANSGNKSLVLTFTPSGTVTPPMYIASRSPTGAYGTEEPVGNSITLQPTSALVTSATGSAGGGFAVRVRAQVDGQWTSSEITTLSVNTGNSKIFCAA